MANIQRPKTPIDETLWRDNAWYRRYGPLTKDTAMDYFRMSSFFDATSNNGVLWDQMAHNQAFQNEIPNLDAFNKRLKDMTGIEYMVVAGSQETTVWVIRKQLRRPMRMDENTGQMVEDVTVLATYYITGENVYQAPSIGAVLQNRMLTTISALRSALSIATNYSIFTPATPSIAAQSQQSSSVPNTQPPPSTQSSTAASIPSSQSRTASANAKDSYLLPRALSLSLKYQHEYMDDHAPVLGDPGSMLQPGASQSMQQSVSRGGSTAPSSQGQGDLRKDMNKNGAAVVGAKPGMAPANLMKKAPGGGAGAAPVSAAPTITRQKSIKGTPGVGA
ncbi:Mediator of RNA polymerase II transcription subunit 6 [Rhizina undulata]